LFVQDTVLSVFQPIPGFISYTGMTRRWGSVSHARKSSVFVRHIMHVWTCL